MCDTFIFNRDSKRYFLKNSDRSPNEPNLFEYVPREKHEEKELKCTYITIPQVEETYEMILVKPSWIWGAEMGMNEYGVSIGNEAVFTKTKSKEESLIGMDYLRLALERGKTARESAQVIIDLLKIYGQGGNCGFDHNFYYNNSYLIVDKNESYCLETVGKDYCLKKVEGSYNISNRLSISKDYLESSKEYPKGFKETNSDFFFTFFSESKKREEKGKRLLEIASPNMTGMISILGNHSKSNAQEKGDCGSICMHKTMIGDHSTGSMIVDYNNDYPVVWLSNGLSPCLSIYKPYFLGKTSFVFFERSDAYKYTEYRMRVNQLILSGAVDKEEYLSIRNKLQKEIVDKVQRLIENGASIDELNVFSKDADLLENKYLNLYRGKVEELRKGKIKLYGRWGKLANKMSKNPFSSSLKERLS